MSGALVEQGEGLLHDLAQVAKLLKVRCAPTGDRRGLPPPR